MVSTKSRARAIGFRIKFFCKSVARVVKLSFPFVTGQVFDFVSSPFLGPFLNPKDFAQMSQRRPSMIHKSQALPMTTLSCVATVLSPIMTKPKILAKLVTPVASIAVLVATLSVSVMVTTEAKRDYMRKRDLRDFLKEECYPNDEDYQDCLCGKQKLECDKEIRDWKAEKNILISQIEELKKRQEGLSECIDSILEAESQSLLEAQSQKRLSKTSSEDSDDSDEQTTQTTQQEREQQQHEQSEQNKKKSKSSSWSSRMLSKSLITMSKVLNKLPRGNLYHTFAKKSILSMQSNCHRRDRCYMGLEEIKKESFYLMGKKEELEEVLIRLEEEFEFVMMKVGEEGQMKVGKEGQLGEEGQFGESHQVGQQHELGESHQLGESENTGRNWWATCRLNDFADMGVESDTGGRGKAFLGDAGVESDTGGRGKAFLGDAGVESDTGVGGETAVDTDAAAREETAVDTGVEIVMQQREAQLAKQQESRAQQWSVILKEDTDTDVNVMAEDKGSVIMAEDKGSVIMEEDKGRVIMEEGKVMAEGKDENTEGRC